jgi:predicted secreted hydrolase
VRPARRALLAGAGGLLLPPLPAFALPRRTLGFPRDHGSHPDYRTEWWYVTGHATAGDGPAARLFGFQLTFFRSRVARTQAMASRLAARQLIFAHAAVTDVRGGRLWHDQRIARASGAPELDQASASTDDTALSLRDWSLQRGADGAYTARVTAAGFTLALRFDPTQPLLPQGDQGLSRKGPEAAQASYYYSQPQLATSGRLHLGNQRFDLGGRAWLDHEWSEALLHPQAVGWDWIGINLDDGSALTAFRLRTRDGQALWDGGSLRTRGGRPTSFRRGDVTFRPVRHWTSPLSQASYPVTWTVRTPAGVHTVRALLDNQELDSRASTGAIYWEGLCELLDSGGSRVGLGYLEMTGYARPLRL